MAKRRVVKCYLRVIFVLSSFQIEKRAEITVFPLFAPSPYVGYPPLTPKLATLLTGSYIRLSSMNKDEKYLPLCRMNSKE